MTSNIRAWGNSQGLYIPKKILKEADLKVNDQVDISVADGAIMIRKDQSEQRKKNAWDSLQLIRDAHKKRKSLSSMDYRAERDEYLDEKYGSR